MNKVIISANLCKEPILRETPNGKAVTTLSVAVNGYNNTTDFFTVNVWGNQAENCAKYLKKGSKVLIEGELHNRSYEDKEGNKRTVCEITALSVEFLTPKSQEQEEVVSAKVERPQLEEITGDFPF